MFGNNILGGLQWKEANKLIRDTARDFIESVGNSYLETSAMDDNLDVRGVVMDLLSNRIQFNVANRVERDSNDCCVYHYFDFNFLISAQLELEQYATVCDQNSDIFGGSCASGGFDISGFKLDAFNASSYEELEVDIWYC